MLLSWRGKQSTSDHTHHLVYSHDPFHALAHDCARKLHTGRQSHTRTQTNKDSEKEWGINQREIKKQILISATKPASLNPNPQMFPRIQNFWVQLCKNSTLPQRTGIYFWGCTWAESGLWIRLRVAFWWWGTQELGGVFESLSAAVWSPPPQESVPATPPRCSALLVLSGGGGGRPELGSSQRVSGSDGSHSQGSDFIKD